MAMIRRAALAAAVLVLPVSCVEIPEGVSPVRGFKVSRYLGTWYEIARLDHPFERGLSRVTAVYGLNEDGTLSIVNRGYEASSGFWRESHGTGEASGAYGTAAFEVTFVWPFAGGYYVVDLDEAEYRWALVAGSTREFLWILSRTPSLDPAVKERLLAKAKASGYDPAKLIWVEHP